MSRLEGRASRISGRSLTELERSARWLATPGRCTRCNKTADGILMTQANERIGPYCFGCSRAILAAVTLTTEARR